MSTLEASAAIERAAVAPALKQLRLILAGGVPQEWRNWAGLTWFAVSRLEAALRQQCAVARAAAVAEAQGCRDLLERCIALKWELHWAAQTTNGPGGLPDQTRLLDLHDRVQTFLDLLTQFSARSVIPKCPEVSPASGTKSASSPVVP